MSTSGLSFQPDMFFQAGWNGGGGAHLTYDAVRGFGNNKELTTDSDKIEGAENADEYGYVSGVTSDGVTYAQGSLGTGSGITYYNINSAKYELWQWKANGSGSANTDGSINSTVSVNTTAGFSIVKATVNHTVSTIGHGLSQAPEVIWGKNLDSQYSWYCMMPMNTSSPQGGWNYDIGLNNANAQSDRDESWNDTAPTSTVFTLGLEGSNAISGDDVIFYCWHSVEGYSRFGNYKGTSNADGAFIYTGFKPAFLIVKGDGSSQHWHLFDCLLYTSPSPRDRG